MEQLDETLGRLLSDPGAMEQIMSLAKSLGSADAAQPTPAETEQPDLSKMRSMIRTDDRQTTLLRALGAYLAPERREKLERAVQLARLSGLMKTAMQQIGTDDGRSI